MKGIITLSVCLFTISLYAQQPRYKLKKTLSKADTTYLLNFIKESFEYELDISYNLGAGDIQPTVEDWPNTEAYDADYLAKYRKEVVNDSLNVQSHNKLAEYYGFHGNTRLAEKHYEIAYLLLEAGKMPIKDSSEYYSFRAMLKMKLGYKGYIEDFELAMSLNPQDSLLLDTYPFLLINDGQYDKARKLAMSILDNEGKHYQLAYIQLILLDILDGYFSYVMDAGKDELKALRKKDFTELVDFSRIDQYVQNYANDPSIITASHMARVFALFMKMSLSEIKKEDIQLPYTANDETVLREEATYFQALVANPAHNNNYAPLKTLGFIHFMLHDWEKALSYFNKALHAFPEGKENHRYNTAEIYGAIETIHYMNKDMDKLEAVLLERIEKQPGLRVFADEFINLAKFYFRDGHQDKAEKWLEKALETNENNVDGLRMRAHFYYLEGNTMKTEYYAQRALRYAVTQDTQRSLVLQFAVYHILDGDANTAYQNITYGMELAKDGVCEPCDELFLKYLEQE